MWIVGSVAAVVGLIVVVVAFVVDPAPEQRERTSQLGPHLPRPGEVRRLRFPTTWWGGYDPGAVDAEVAELADRYEALYLAAGPSVIAEAERRLGNDPEPGTEAGAGPARGSAAGSAQELEDGGRDGAGVLDR